MKIIMILGAGRGQVGLYKQAKKMGIRTIAVTIPGDYPCLPLADEIAYIDIRNKDAVLEYAEEKKIDGIVTSCMDLAVPSIGFVCDNMNLNGISYEAALVSTDKHLMKEAFARDGVRTAKYVKIDKGEDYSRLISKLEYPIIVKPVDLAGSRGINVVQKPSELESAVNSTLSTTSADYYIIEEYLKGTEFSATAFVEDGKVIFTLPTGDVRYGERGEVPGGHYLPYEMDDDVSADFDKQIKAGIESIGLNNCAVNADVMLVGKNVYILEMTGRIGANCIPELSSIYLGKNIYRMIIENALGYKNASKDVRSGYIPSRACYARMIASENEGILEEVCIPNLAGCTCDMFKKAGDRIKSFTCTDDFIGQVIAEAETLNDAKIRVDELVDNIVIRLRDR